MLVSYYLDRGVAPETILNLSEQEAVFYTASMLYWGARRS